MYSPSRAARAQEEARFVAAVMRGDASGEAVALRDASRSPQRRRIERCKAPKESPDGQRRGRMK